MKHIIIKILSTAMLGMTLLRADVVANPHEYVESTLDRLKSQKIGLSEGYDGHIAKFQNLKNQLPAEEAEFKVLIDKGVMALQKMRDSRDDSKLTDLSSLGVKFSEYYLAHKEELDAASDSELSQAFDAFLCGGQGAGEPPHRFFSYLIDRILYSYLHYYTMEDFGEAVPNYARKAMVDSLSWITASGDDTGEGHFNSNLIYYFAELWEEVSARLDTLSNSQRELVLAELESAIEDNDQFENKIENKARQNLAAARVRYPKN